MFSRPVLIGRGLGFTKNFVLAMESSRGRAPYGAPSLTTDFGDYCIWVTPVPIPNTEVKPDCADGTWVDSPWESRSSPDFSRRPRFGGAFSRFGVMCGISRRWLGAKGRPVGSAPCLPPTDLHLVDHHRVEHPARAAPGRDRLGLEDRVGLVLVAGVASRPRGAEAARSVRLVARR